MISQIFVNVYVNDLEKSKSFWTAAGFTFNPQFTNDQGASLVLSDSIFVMLLKKEFFATFTTKSQIDTQTSTEVINALGVDSRAYVDDLLNKVLAVGATEYRPPSDYGWMYSRSFQDLDGHLWEVVYVDLASAPARPDSPAKQ